MTVLHAFEQNRKLGRGINLGDALDAPQEGVSGSRIEDRYFKMIKEAGFDSVRIPVKWSNKAETAAPFPVSSSFFGRVDEVVDSALSYGLNTVINIHHYDEIMQDADGHHDRFIALWKQIAERYKDRPSSLYFELLNEPFGSVTAEKWNQLLAEAIAEIRKIDPVHTLIVGGVDWNMISGLQKLQLPAGEQNLIATFHYYNPAFFTHQGATWMPPEVNGAFQTLGVSWPGPPESPVVLSEAVKAYDFAVQFFESYNSEPSAANPAGPHQIAKELEEAAAWSKQNNRPLWMGEFGAIALADMESRARWAAFVRQEAERLDISWACWAFEAGFSVYNREANDWHKGLLDALIPISSTSLPEGIGSKLPE